MALTEPQFDGLRTGAYDGLFIVLLQRQQLILIVSAVNEFKTMKVSIRLTVADWRKFLRFASAYALQSQPQRLSSFWKNFVAWVVIALVMVYSMDSLRAFHPPTATWVATIFVLLIAVYGYQIFRIQRGMEPAPDGMLCAEHTYTFSDSGISAEDLHYRSEYQWDAVRDLVRNEDMIFLFLDRSFYQCHSLPMRMVCISICRIREAKPPRRLDRLL